MQETQIWLYYQIIYVQTRIWSVMYIIFCDFEIQTDHLTLARRPDLVKKKKKKKKRNLPNSELCRSSGPQSENLEKKTDKSLDFFPDN